MDIVTLGAALHGAKMYTDATIAPLLGGVHYRGSVNYVSNLPASPEEGDAYTVKYKGTTGTDPNGAEYVWGLDTDDNTYKWIVFSADSYTRAEVDNLLSGKQNVIDSEHKLNSDLVDDLTDKTVRNKTIHYYKGIWDISNDELTILNNKMMEFKTDTDDRLLPAPSSPNTYPPVYLELYKKNNDTYSFCGICEYDGYNYRFTGMRYTIGQSGGEDFVYDIKFIAFQTMYVSSFNKIILRDYDEASSCDLKLVGYSKPQSTSAITTSDTVSSAIGKLEKGLDGKQATLTFDTTPTENSTNPVTSGGIYNVIGDINTVLEEVL